MRFNLKTGAASQKQLSLSIVDFPRINEGYTGRSVPFARTRDGRKILAKNGILAAVDLYFMWRLGMFGVGAGSSGSSTRPVSTP